MRYLLILLLFSAAMQAQIKKKPDVKKNSDTLVIDNGKKDSVVIYKPTIDDYRYKTEKSDYKSVDTTFAAHNAEVYTQYNNRDNFGKIQFANIGSGFQNLQYEISPEQELSLMPANKSYWIKAIKEVRYYDVKTPTTQFVYHSAMKNGGVLQSRYTQNFGKYFNFAVEYAGLRSQGFYNNSLAANNNFTVSAHFQSRNGRYEFYTHFLHQNVNNEEYGGISDLSLFLGGDSRFDNRQNLEVNMNGSNSRFAYRRYYFSQSYLPFNQEKFPFKINHQFFYQSNRYNFNLSSSDTSLFEAYVESMGTTARKYSKNLSNTISLIFNNPKFYLDAGVRHQHITLGTGRVLTDGKFDTEDTENRIGALGNLKINLWNKFDLNAALEYSNGKTFGNFLKSENHLKFEPIKDFFVDGTFLFRNAAPTFNYLVNFSPVLNYNYRFMDFKNESVTQIGGTAGVKWFDTRFFVNLYRIDNFTYFDSSATPKQSGSSLNISQLGGEATFSYRKFHLNTRVQFQSNLTHKDLFPTPDFIGRANLYYKTDAFKKAAQMMTGLRIYYFSKFASREYSPILNEFFLPTASGYSIGGQPIADAYFNLRVKTMQIYVEAQHFTTTFMQNKSYTAPYYPIYDFRLNIGILWNLFH